MTGRSLTWIIPITVVTTLLVVFLVLNLSLGNKQIDQRVAHRYAVADAQFRRTMGSLLGPALLEGNHVEALANGDEIFPAMLTSIRGAHETITFETYIYWSGRIGAQFAEALAERAAHGVRVHVLVDWVGSNRLEAQVIERMTQAGVITRRYNKPRWYSLDRLNHRTHRKLLVIDGTTGFTGGVGVADPWLGHAQDSEHWRDMHYRVTGPVVAQMQAAFADNWLQATGEVLDGPRYLPALARAGTHSAQVFTSSPGGGAESMQLMYLLSIAAATESIDLSMSYFVPDNVANHTLVAALKRGVRVRMILPGSHMDRAVVRKASRSEWGALLAAGAEIYEYQPTMYHCKVMIVDHRWVSVGSTNFDSRSFSVNDEANLNVYDEIFAEAQSQTFATDLAQSRRISLQEWQRRPLREKALDWLSTLIGSQL